MARAVGFRFAAGVIGAIAGSLALVISLLMLLFGGVLSAVSSTSGHSLAGSGALLLLFSLATVVASAGFFVLPWARLGALILAVLTALILWAFSLVDAVGLSMVVVIPLCAAVLCGLISAGPNLQHQQTSER